MKTMLFQPPISEGIPLPPIPVEGGVATAAVWIATALVAFIFAAGWFLWFAFTRRKIVLGWVYEERVQTFKERIGSLESDLKISNENGKRATESAELMAKMNEMLIRNNMRDPGAIPTVRQLP